MYLRSRLGMLPAMTIVGVAVAALCSTAIAQNLIEGPPPPAKVKNANIIGNTLDFPTGEYQAIDLATGPSINMAPKPTVVWEHTLRVANVAWLRVYFSDVHLENGSFVRLTSLHDGEVQKLDAHDMAMWSNSSAYFNGNELKIELVADAFSIDNEFRINEFAFEVGTANRGDGCGICGNDDRAPSSDNNFCRLMPVGCSATTYNADSCMVTAGHCLGSSGSVVQFNVPASNGDCSTNNPPVADQFPVTSESGVSGGVGNDYGALQIGTNSSGERPYDRYGTYIPLASSVPSSGTISNHGYGVDSQCSRSQTQQTHTGPISYVDSSTVVYDLDMTYGNSGSSLIYQGEIIGVVTHCSYSCENYGTRIDTAGFVSARATACDGDEPPGGCAAGEIEDCFGNCCPANWVGDGYCDDGTYSHNGVPIYLNCEEFNCDGGDCPPESCDGGGDPTGGCCVGTSCSVITQAECNAMGGSYLGDNSTCAGDPCGGGGGGDGDACGDAVAANDGGNAFDTSSNSDSGFGEPDDSQCADTYLEWDGSPDFWFTWTAAGNGTASFSTCDAGSFDTSMVIYQGSSCSSLSQVACNGDAAPDGSCQQYHSQVDGLPVSSGQTFYIRLGGWQAATGSGTLTITPDYGGGGDPTGGCCVGTSCSVGTEADCEAMGGSYLGDNSSCTGNPCGGGGGGDSYLEITGIDSIDSYQSPNNVLQTITIPAGSNITGVGWEDVTLSAYDPSWGSEAGIMFNWENDGQPFAGYILIFDEDTAPGDFGPSTGFEDLTQDWNFSDADGEIVVEFFETYDDAEGVVDGQWTGGRIYIEHDGDGGDPTGGCCVGYDCSVGTAAACSAMGGDYLGDGTSCSGDPCGSPPASGGCCINTECSIMTADDCAAFGGSYLGDDSDCSGNPCDDPPATGACCIGPSCGVATQADCEAAGGSYYGDGSNCTDVTCDGGGGGVDVTHVISGTNLVSGMETYTVDLYITLEAGARLDAVAGTPEQTKTLTSSGDFYQHSLGGSTSDQVNPALYESYPELEWDSRVTIGALDSSGNPHDENNLQYIGIDWTDFEAGNDLSADNGLWFVLPEEAQGEAMMFTAQDCTQQYGVLIARVTTIGSDSEIGFSGVVQGRDASDELYQETVETYFGYTSTEDCNGNMVPDACDIANGTSDDADGNGIPDECDSTCPGDADGDGDSDVDDILHVISFFGLGDGGDVNGDGETDVDDLLQVIASFGTC